jgi:charged multivesicular body protein 2A
LVSRTAPQNHRKNRTRQEVTRIQAKDLVRCRSHIKKMILMKSQIQTVSLSIQGMKSTNTMAQAMSNVTKAMGRMNKSMNMPQITAIMAEFEKQSEMMSMKQEIMDDAVDDVMGEEDDEEETEAIVDQVFMELGLNISEEMSTPGTGGMAPTTTAPAATDADADLMARLENLRGGGAA